MKDIARPDIKPAFAERNVPVALATDENFLPYLKVAINSAIASSPGSNLDVIVLHAGVPEDAIRTFVAGYAGVGNASVRFVDISDELVASGLSDYKQAARLPLSACYRLLLPRVLAEYDKVVYLDVDVAVCRDLGELYATDVGDNWFAAAKDVVYTTKPEYVSWAAKWGFEEWDGYVNTGALVMNLERFRREPVFDRLKEIVFEAAKWNCDQDALNFVCKGAIAPLDPRWNVQLGDYCLAKQIALTGDEMWIAHYTSYQKPWKLPARRYSHLWWLHVDESDVSRFWADVWGEAYVPPVAATPKVSVIIPIHNSEKYLPEALASVLMQKELPEIEVICIDDGSTDDSAAILEFWQARDSRLKVMRQERQGAGVARNAGMDAARGEYVFFHDADDRIASAAAFRQSYEQAKDDDLDILLANASLMSESGETIKNDAHIVDRGMIPKERVFGPDALGANLYIAVSLGPFAKMFRRRFLDDNRLRFPAMRRSEDLPMVRLAVSLAHRLGVLFQTVYDYRKGVATSLESTKDETPLIFAEAEQVFRDSLAERGLLDRFKIAADVALLSNLDYNLRLVNRFSSFKALARFCAEALPGLKIGEGLSAREPIASLLKRVERVVAAKDDTDSLADIFAEIKGAQSRYLSDCRVVRLKTEKADLQRQLDANRKKLAELWRQKTAAEKAKAELWKQKDAAEKAKAELWKQKDAAEKAKAELWKQKDAAEKAKAELWRQKAAAEKAKADLWMRLQEKEEARRKLAELVRRLAKTVE